jgi:hypothetical protein
MDENKLKKLKEIEYSINICCGICEDGKFEKGSLWGTCNKYKYKHLKHTESERNMSIFIFGSCPESRLDSKTGGILDKFNEFQKGFHKENS